MYLMPPLQAVLAVLTDSRMIPRINAKGVLRTDGRSPIDPPSGGRVGLDYSVQRIYFPSANGHIVKMVRIVGASQQRVAGVKHDALS